MKKRQFILIFFILISGALWAQHSVKGVITDEKGESIPGANIVLKGSSVGTTSDMSGKYSINLPSGKGTLIFSFIGFSAIEEPVGNRQEINVKLQSSTELLGEVIAIGYGTVKKRDLTGSIAKVEMQDMQQAPVKSFDEALGGRIAGVQVTSSEGKPGAGTKITIRGGNSITQDNSPLYVIDGFAVENPDNSALDPADIQSIDVLKDASATAIYGARGANGVIIITTKKGVIGAAKVTYDGFYGFQDNPKNLDVLNPSDYVQLMIEQNPDPLGATKRYLTDLGKTVADYKNEPGYNWQNEIFRTAPIQSHRVGLSGGTNDTRYSISLSAYNQDGIIINSGFNRYMGKINLDQNIGKNIKTGVTINYTRSKTFGSSPSDPTQGHTFHNYLFYSVLSYAPVSTGANLLEEPFDPNNNPTQDYRFNPVLSVNNEIRDNFNNNLNINAYGELAILDNLKLKVTGGFTDNGNTIESFNNSLTRYGNPTRPEGVNGSIQSRSSIKWSNENTLNYNYNKGSHSLTAMLGFSSQGGTDKYYLASVNQVPHESLGVPGLGEGTPVDLSTGLSEWKLQSYFGRAFYSLMDRYLFTATLRADGSSKFPKANRWGYFPSGSFAWRVSEEPFMQNLTSTISNLKLRASWGQTGNNRVGNYDYFAKLTSIDPNATGVQLIYPFNNIPTIGTYNSSVGNSSLKWETTDQTDFGIDIGLFKSRITIEADVYRKDTRDLLLSANMVPSSGYASAIKNVGKMRNDGLEITLNTVNIDTKNFKWRSNFNISFNRNTVLGLAENQTRMDAYVTWDQTYNAMPAYSATIGNSLGNMLGYKWAGVYQTEDFDITYDAAGKPLTYIVKAGVPYFGTNNASNRPGQIKYQDVSGPNGVPDNKIDANDRTIIGNGLPKHIGGFSNSFDYKGFDLNIFFQWSYGNDILNANRLVMEQMERDYTNQFTTVLNRWTPENPTNEMFGVKGNPSPAYSSRVVEDGSFLRLKTLSLGYTFNTKLTQKINISKIRIYSAVQNLITWTNYSGYDPEVSAKSSPLTPGFDYSSYPRERTVTFGVNVNF